MRVRRRVQCSYCGKVNNTLGKTYVLCSWCGHRVYSDMLKQRQYRRKTKEERFESNARHNLIKAREESGLTLKQVSKITFYSDQTIHRAEFGTLYEFDGTEASNRFFEAMEKLYGIPKEVLRKRGR